jgi:hypothetical protein
MRLALACLAVLALGACATVTRYDAAGDIHALLVAIRDDDRQAFDAHVDRPALKAQMKSRISAAAIERGGALGGFLAQAFGGVTDAIVDGAVQPSVFLAVAEAKGYRPSQPLPSRVAITGSLRYLEGDRVCVVDKKDGPCLLLFANEAGAWRLVAFEGPLDALKLPRAG